MNENGLPVPLQLDDRKERAVRRLGTHFAEDHLSVEDFEDRVDRVYSAATPVEIESVFQGLPTLVDSSVPERIAGTALPSRVRAEDVPRHGFQIAVMSGVDRKGRVDARPPVHDHRDHGWSRTRSARSALRTRGH